MIGHGVFFSGTRDSVPDGWLVCDGSTYKHADYPALSGLMAPVWGGSAGGFDLPNCTAHFPWGTAADSSPGGVGSESVSPDAGASLTGDTGSASMSATAHAHTGSGSWPYVPVYVIVQAVDDAEEPPVGSMFLWLGARNTIPGGYLECNGRAIGSDYPHLTGLFSGTSWAGKIPQLQGLTCIGPSSGAEPGTASGGSGLTLSGTSGASTANLSVGTIGIKNGNPSTHTHALTVGVPYITILWVIRAA